MMSRSFYQDLEILDAKIALKDITPEAVDQVIQYVSGEKFARYFFRTIDNPDWIDPLNSKGLFNNVPAPVQDEENPSYYKLPNWYAGEYLNRYADQYPSIVRDIALKFITDNSRATRLMLECLMKIPGSYSVDVIPVIGKWMKSDFSRSMLISSDLGKLMGYLVEEDNIEGSIEILNILTRPRKVTQDAEKTVAGSNFDSYWVNEAFDNFLSDIYEKEPIPVIDILENNLKLAYEMEGGDEKFWFYQIEPEKDERYRTSIKNTIKDALIHVLDFALSKEEPLAKSYLERYIFDEYLFLRRIGLYVLRICGNKFPDILEKVYLDYLLNSKGFIRNDVFNLLTSKFDYFPEYIRRLFVGDLLNIDNSEFEKIAKYIQEDPDRFIGDSNEEKITYYIKRIHISALIYIEKYLDSDLANYFSGLVDEIGRPEEYTLDKISGTISGPISPISHTEISKRPIADLVEYLIDFEPTSDSLLGEPSTEGLGREFELDVMNRASDYAKNAELFSSRQMRYVYVYHYFMGLEKAIKSGIEVEIEKPVDLIKIISEREPPDYELQRYEPGLDEAQLWSLHLLQAILNNKEISLNLKISKKVKVILNNLIKVGKECHPGEDTDDYPVNTSLNTIYGMVLHCLMCFALERNRHIKDDEDKKDNSIIPYVKEHLETELEETEYPKYIANSVAGQYIAQLDYLDSDWVTSNLIKIFPEGPDNFKCWYAAWSSFVGFSDVYKNLFPRIMPQYVRFFDELKRLEEDKILRSLDESISTHILKAYLMELIDLDSEDGLMIKYHQYSSDRTRAHGVFWISKVIETEQPKLKDETWKRSWNLWLWRLESVAEADNPLDFSDEISSFTRILKNCPEKFMVVFPVIKKTIQYFDRDYELDLIVNYLGIHCSEYAKETNAILLEIINTRKNLYKSEETKENIRRILLAANKKDKKTINYAIDTINILGIQGEYEWRSILEEIQT